jgi:putative peptidoglycan lipid II flippase
MTAQTEPAPRPRGMSLQNAAVLMVVATMGSRVTGMVQMMVMAHFYAASGELSAFYAACTLPDLVYFLIAGGALRSGFIPVVSGYLARGEMDRLWQTFSSLFWFMLGAAGLVVATGMIFAPQFARLVVPGWAVEHPELIKPCGEMMRILFPAQLFLLLGGGLFMGVLNAQKRFTWPAIGPIVYNFFIIGGAIAGHYLYGLKTVAFALVLGAFVANFLMQVPPLLRSGARLRLKLDLHDEGMWRVLGLAAPIIIGLAVSEINWMVVRMLATYTGEHGPAVLEYANRFWKLPSGVFGAGIAIALLPTLSEHFARGDEKAFTKDFSFGLRHALFLTLPATLVIGVLRVPLVRLLFEHGTFSATDTAAVSSVLLWLTPAMAALSVTYIVARAFYARHDTVTPVIVGLTAIAVCGGLGLALVRTFELEGLAVATSAGNIVNALVMLIVLKRKVRYLEGRRTAESVLRMAAPCGLMGVVMWAVYGGTEYHLGTHGLAARAVGLLLPLTCGLLTFVATAVLFGCEELGPVLRGLLRSGRAHRATEE